MRFQKCLKRDQRNYHKIDSNGRVEINIIKDCTDREEWKDILIAMRRFYDRTGMEFSFRYYYEYSYRTIRLTFNNSK